MKIIGVEDVHIRLEIVCNIAEGNLQMQLIFQIVCVIGDIFNEFVQHTFIILLFA